MELSEFVKQSLTQIVKGAKESQDEIRGQGGYANPAVFTSASGKESTTHFGSVSDVKMHCSSTSMLQLLFLMQWKAASVESYQSPPCLN